VAVMISKDHVCIFFSIKNDEFMLMKKTCFFAADRRMFSIINLSGSCFFGTICYDFSGRIEEKPSKDLQIWNKIHCL